MSDITKSNMMWDYCILVALSYLKLITRALTPLSSSMALFSEVYRATKGTTYETVFPECGGATTNISLPLSTAGQTTDWIQDGP